MRPLYVDFDPACIVADDPGEVIRHAMPRDARATAMLLEQQIARLHPDAAAVRQREARISREQAIAAGRVRELRRGCA